MKSSLNQPPPAASPKPALDNDGLDTRDFVISHISSLNVLLKRRAAIYARRAFGFTLTEWRILTLLRTSPAISVRELALEALADSAQISRAAARLVSKGYLTRQQSALDKREALLALTRRGMQVSQEMCEASLRRNEELLVGFSQKQIRALIAMLDELTVRSRAMVAADETADQIAAANFKRKPPRPGARRPRR
jgi:DNA-binding MarR family transcriptional regulator